MENNTVASARHQLQFARTRTRTIGGLQFPSEPWGIVGDADLAPVFRAFARPRGLDDNVEFLWDVYKEPGVRVGAAMLPRRSAYYYIKYLEEPGRDDPYGSERGALTLNLPPELFDEARDLFGPGAAAPSGAVLEQLQSEFLFRLAASVNHYLKFNAVAHELFFKSQEFGAHLTKAQAQHAQRVSAAAANGFPGRFHAHPVLRFGKKP